MVGLGFPARGAENSLREVARRAPPPQRRPVAGAMVAVIERSTGETSLRAAVDAREMIASGAFAAA